MKQLRLSLIITFGLALVRAQDKWSLKEIIEIFENASTTRDPFNTLIEITTAPNRGFGALDTCGKGSQEGTHACVPYFQCDGITKMIIQDGSVNGIGVINLRFGANECKDYLDVCCGIPVNTTGPGTDTPVNPTTSSESPPITPVVTSVTPPVTPTTPRHTTGPGTNTPVNPTTSSESPITPVVTSVTPSVTPTTPGPISLDCGVRNSEGIDFKITGNGNNETQYGEFPWMVALLWKDFNSAKHEHLCICGGSLIAPNVVLTAAHCVADLQPNQYKIRAGEWDTQTEKERYPYQERDVVQAIIHENYTPKAVYNNVALLILNSHFDRAAHIGTICLPSQNEIITSRNCYATGWGKDVFGKKGNYQVILKKIELPMIQHAECQKALRRTRLGQIFNLHPSFICAGGELGKDTCSGDGGSPLVCPDPANPRRYVQSGIVSWGIGCGEYKIPGVYADVAKFRNWIDDHLSILNINTDSYTL